MAIFNQNLILRSYDQFVAHQSYASRQSGAKAAREFLNWLEKHKIALEDITQSQAIKFIYSHRNQKSATYLHRRVQTRKFIIWLVETKGIRVEVEKIFPPYKPLPREIPPLAQKYLEQHKLYWSHYFYSCTERTLEKLHLWLKKEKIPIAKLNPDITARFIQSCHEENLQSATIGKYKAWLAHYSEWLQEKKVITFSKRDLFPIPKRGGRYDYELPEAAIRFLSLIQTTHRTSTLWGYKIAIRSFHCFLQENLLSFKRLNRSHLELWYQDLYKRGLASETRASRMIQIRIYLHWLYEHRKFPTDPSLLIKSSDIPKKPLYLPRPLPLDIDRELQSRFENSDSIRYHGLLLMRLTGMRLGELKKLKKDSLYLDENGNYSLRLPLGKLQKERLVPLDARATAIFKKIQSHPKNYFQIRSPYLISNRYGKSYHSTAYQASMSTASQGLKTAEPITSHRLRHSYATQLLNAGMSLFGLMKILGHHDVKMTLRYAAVSPENLREQYCDAITKIEQRYNIPQTSSAARGPAIKEEQPLKDIALKLKKFLATCSPKEKRELQLLLKRIYKLDSEVKKYL